MKSTLEWLSPANDRYPDHRMFKCEGCNTRFRIHIDQILSPLDELRRGSLIQYEIDGNNTYNLQLLRGIGRVEWYRSDKGYGVARNIRQIDIATECQEVFIVPER
jgi:hypothetical protein